MTLAIGPLEPEDLDDVAELSERVFTGGERWNRGDLAQAASSRVRRAYVARDGARAVGYVVAQRIEDEAEILSVGVHPARRRQGIGARLLEAALADLGRSGARRVVLEVRADDPAAGGLYRRLGFVESGRRRAYYADGTDARLLRLDL